MQEDFHYYATYCAAYIAGYSHEESMDICYSAQFVDLCTRTYLAGIRAPISAATTQLQLELAESGADPISLQDMTRIWASFHFLPRDLKAEPDRKCAKRYKNKYRLICGPNGDLLVDTVKLAKGKPLQAVGLAMHVLADTWAHRYFAGTPSLAINNTYKYFFEYRPENGETVEARISFNHNPGSTDDIVNSCYTNSVHQNNENSIMNLGHGRAGHLPDYSWAIYRYMPAWGDYKVIIKDNPLDYTYAFTQMIYALKYLRGAEREFKTDTYDVAAISMYKDEIKDIITKRQLNACADWKAFGERLSGRIIDDFDIDRYREEYISAKSSEKDDTFLGRFIIAAMAQKSMVTNRIFKSGNKLAGYSIDYETKGLGGIRDYFRLLKKNTEFEINDLAEDMSALAEETAEAFAYKEDKDSGGDGNK